MLKIKKLLFILTIMSDGTSGDFIIRTRNVLWREVAREGGSKELARAHVNLPAEVVKDRHNFLHQKNIQY
jgi:hypothetical protein